ERIGLVGQRHRLILLSRAVPARTIADKSGVDSAVSQLTANYRAIYPRWSESRAGRVHSSDSVRCWTRNSAPEKTRPASDPNDAGSHLRSIDRRWLCMLAHIFMGRKSWSWFVASVA